MTAAGLVGGCRPSCCGTAGPIAPVPAGPASTSAGWAPNASTTTSCGPPSATTGRWRPPVAPRWRPSRPTWPWRRPSRRSPTRWRAWAPTAASASWVPYRWPPRSVIGGGSPMRARSWPSLGWCPAGAPPETASGVATSPAPAAKLCGSSWWSRPGRTITAPSSPGPCESATSRSAPTPWLAPGPRSCGCAAALRQLERRKHTTGVAVAAVARELAGFLWAEMQA
jgi:hypothetical protein